MSSKEEKVQDLSLHTVLVDENRALKDQVQILKNEVHNLRTRLEESEELKRAISEEDLGALVFPGPEGNLIFTLDSADHAYRTLVKTMNKGTAILGFDGTILYCNHTFVIFLRMQPQKIVGTSIYRFITPENVIIFKALLENEMERGVIKLLVEGGISLPVCLSINSLWIKESPNAWCIVVTYMTKLKKANEILKLKLEELARSNEELNNLLHFIS